VTPSANGGLINVAGELELLGKRAPLSFELQAEGGGRIAGSATVKQTDWGIKPYSALFGTLKVLDELVVSIDGTLPTA
jgi:polyisoprenoid-binding protein YceI